MSAGAGFDLWHHRIEETFGFDFRAADGRAVGRSARLTTRSLGPVRTSVMSVPPVEISAHRTPGLIRRHDSYTYGVQMVLDGGMVVDQDGRRAVLRPGDFALCDVSRPVTISSTGRSRQRLLIVGIPYGLLPLPRRRLAKVTGVKLPARSPVGRLTSELLRRLPAAEDDPEDYPPAAAARVSSVVVDLIAAALAGPAGEPPPDPDRRTLLHRIHAYIEMRLADPALTPASVAAAHHISVRMLHKLFEGEDTTVAAWIRHRRLERCRRDLADPVRSRVPVGAIGAAWAFADPAHFTRTFRKAYGLTPSEYRGQAAPHMRRS